MFPPNSNDLFIAWLITNYSFTNLMNYLVSDCHIYK
ncbi:hypothetical protein T12_6933 [Trichinella patagoniensis]|uniref:Uncharacterized protein n=1 Tax=Trichinella patagoniensis TaxID=990121 RepID=A0A0V0Z0K0_9BILA|nr:hypothetical protein T12_5824 [Trichinella patagoniensis]KRY06553.1 hypothetical protein T12_6933 [Trichinella patagoniensis]